MDSIDETTFDVDSIDGTPQATLILEGDFVDACEKYLEAKDQDDPNYSKLYFRISRSVAEDLVTQIGSYL